MANLLNVVEHSEPEAILTLEPDLEARWNSVTSEQDSTQWLKHKRKKIPKGFASKSIDDWVSHVVDTANEEVEDLIWDTYLEMDQLPVPMVSRAPSVLHQLSQTPRAQLADLIEVTQRLGFIIIPWDYLDPLSYASELPGMREAIESFGSIEERMDVYVICPPTYYSLEKHLKAEDPNLPIFAGKNEQAFMALRMTVPTLRAMQKQIDTLYANQEVMRRNQEGMGNAIRQLAQGQDDLRDQVDELKKSVQMQLEEMQNALQAEIRNTTFAAVSEAQAVLGSGRASAKQRAEAQRIVDSIGSMNLASAKDALSALREMRFDLLEPLMFAVKTDTSLRDPHALAVIGPCWGPDFEDIVAVAAKMNVDRDRRHRAEKMLEVWGEIYGRRERAVRQREEEARMQEQERRARSQFNRNYYPGQSLGLPDDYPPPPMLGWRGRR